MLVFLPLVERLTGIESNKNILFIKKALANLPELFFIITNVYFYPIFKEVILKEPANNLSLKS